MLFIFRRCIGIVSITLLMSMGSYGVFAQEMTTTPKKIDDTLLTSLYALQLENPGDAFLEKRIQEERENIRNSIEDELNALIAIPAEEEEIDNSGELSKALERQKKIISALQERLRERKVDLALLAAEEQKFYLNSQSGSSAIAEFKTTKSYPQLLARKLIMEERIAMLESLLPLQGDRLSRLAQDQRMQQFGSLAEFGRFALIVLIIILIERFVRHYVFARISNRAFRYSSIKLFSSIIYIVMFLWLFGVVYTRNPGVLASFAIIGAGIAIAMQDVIKDIVGWFIIHQSHLFTYGDRISIGNRTGEVLDIGLLHTKVLEVGMHPDIVLEQTGKVLSIANGKILTEPVTNYNTTSDFMKAEMFVTITFESDWQLAEKILLDVLMHETAKFAERDRKQHSMRTRTMYVAYEPSDPLVLKEIADDGVVFILRFPVPIGTRRTVVTKLTSLILDRFNAEQTVQFAYKTTRYYTEK